MATKHRKVVTQLKKMLDHHVFLKSSLLKWVFWWTFPSISNQKCNVFEKNLLAWKYFNFCKTIFHYIVLLTVLSSHLLNIYVYLWKICNTWYVLYSAVSFWTRAVLCCSRVYAETLQWSVHLLHIRNGFWG